jgi:hypothetical protein
MVKSQSGFPVQSPCVSIATRQAEVMLRISAEFGFTPAAANFTDAPVHGPPVSALSP